MTFQYNSICDITKLLNLHNIKCSPEELNIIKNKDSYIKKNYVTNNSNIIQFGSGEAFYNYKMKIKFYVSKDSGGTTISLHNENDEEKDTCLMMTVSTDLGGDAEINILNNEGNCISDNGLFKLSGTHILTIAIDFIKSIKSKYNVKRITLSDHATKLCGNQKLKLSILCTLLYGHTWYGKHGFRPTSKQEDKINILDVYNKNTKIARFTKVPAIKTLRKYIDDFYHHKKCLEQRNTII